MHSSSGGTDKTMDAIRLLRFYGKRLVKVAGRKVYGKSFFQPTADEDGHAKNLTSSAMCAEGIRRLQQLGVIAPHVGPQDMGGRAGRMIGLGLLLEAVESSGPIHVTA